MKEIIVNIKTGAIEERNFTKSEILKLEEDLMLHEFEQSLQPSKEELEQAEFELKTIEILITLGVI